MRLHRRMQLHRRKVLSIILEQRANIEERCNGYGKEIINVINDILEYEQGHRVSATNIQKKINDKFNATAQFLSEQRSQDRDTEKRDS